jgi:hypothetical protein
MQAVQHGVLSMCSLTVLHRELVWIPNVHRTNRFILMRPTHGHISACGTINGTIIKQAHDRMTMSTIGQDEQAEATTWFISRISPSTVSST